MIFLCYMCRFAEMFVAEAVEGGLRQFPTLYIAKNSPIIMCFSKDYCEWTQLVNDYLDAYINKTLGSSVGLLGNVGQYRRMLV